MDDPYPPLPPTSIVANKVAPEQPQHIGRYRVVRVLGEGGFGIVYLAHDEQLQRPVAIKVAHRRLIVRPEDAEAHLTEARTVAGLDHPNIVPVYDVGSSEEYPVFIVSKYIEGCTLAQRIKTDRPTVAEAAELTAVVAETLHYAHRQELVHRDVKPGNILLDKSGKPFVADFGLALRECDVGKGARFAGTPVYMSPEQARGEGHRVDGRSDLFSLGVVFYELLTGRRPFRGATLEELLEQVQVGEVRPARQWDGAIPKELDRICQKALSKRASERYATGKDMADDLRHFFEQATEEEKRSLRSSVAAANVPGPTPASTPVPNPVPTPRSDSDPIRIVPKGLRSFDAHDADFFLELLPGPHDRDGLPDSIRFWKTRIEEMDADNTFAVGLIYGPSGCGKSSLMKAGLLPRLSDKAIAVYVESTAEETEVRLLNGLRKRCPDLPANLGLKETLAALRRGQGIPSGKKVLIVLDQFEQWLHAKKEAENTELVQALRQCEGSRVQCIVMVRDDFWLAVSRFLKELEIRLVEGQNSALVDLFPIRHAEKVLAAFGRSFGALPENSNKLGKDQKEFLDQAVRGLAQAGKVVCVRLALFAEMMKGKAWTPTTLKAVGGTEGIGAIFLEETFSMATAPPEHRYHQKAARSVLQMLLPDSGSDIKGLMRSHQELLGVSGYSSRPREFDELLRILDGELRLITPTDPEGKEGIDVSASQVQPGQKYYQLTHDYLVPSLRDWLTRKQKETRRGRAELLLVDRAGVWNARPENRQLPSLWQWVQIKWLTAKKNWTPPQRKMMRKANRYHVMRAGVLFAFLAVLGWCGWQINGSLRASGLVRQLLDADIEKVPDIVRELESYRRWAEPRLRASYTEAESGGHADRQLRASLALLPSDNNQAQYLRSRLLDGTPQEVLVLRQELAAGKDDGWLSALWQVVQRPEKQAQQLRAACALALYDAENPQWGKASGAVVARLVIENPVYLEHWLNGFRPVRNALRPALVEVYLDKREDHAAERGLATNILSDYAVDDANVLGDLILEAEAKQFVVLAPRLQPHREAIVARMEDELKKKPPAGVAEEKQVALAKRQARAAEAMLYLDREEAVWPRLQHSPDPTVRSYLVNGFADHGVDPALLVRRLQVPDLEVSERRALLLALGAYAPERVPDGMRNPLLQKLRDDYQNHPDAGVHGSTEWLLRQWGRLSDVSVMEQRLRGRPPEKRQWYVNGQEQSFTIVREGKTFLMGSPESEAGHRPNENRHKRKIPRSFAVAAKEVTRGQFERFLAANPTIKKQFDANGQAGPLLKQYSPEADTPIVLMNWYLAAQYCNWLSKEDGIAEDQWCYPSDPKKIAAAMVLGTDFLDKAGYRLPSEAEWECVCRAGADTSRHYGGGEELLRSYAWYLQTSPNRSQVVGRLRPNDWGLFDTYGNAYEWCHDAYGSYEVKEKGITSDIMDKKDTLSTSSRVLRGGSFDLQALNARSSYRYANAPTNRSILNGFRLARTLPLNGFTALPPPASPVEKQKKEL